MAGAYYLGVLLLQRVVTPTRCYPTYYRWGDISLYFFTLLFSTVYLALRSCTALLHCALAQVSLHPTLQHSASTTGNYVCTLPNYPNTTGAVQPNATRHPPQHSVSPGGTHLSQCRHSRPRGGQDLQQHSGNSTVATTQWPQSTQHGDSAPQTITQGPGQAVHGTPVQLFIRGDTHSSLLSPMQTPTPTTMAPCGPVCAAPTLCLQHAGCTNPTRTAETTGKTRACTVI